MCLYGYLISSESDTEPNDEKHPANAVATTEQQYGWLSIQCNRLLAIYEKYYLLP